MTTFVLGAPLLGLSADRPVTLSGDPYDVPILLLGASGSFDVAGWGAGPEPDDPDTADSSAVQPFGATVWVDYFPTEAGVLTFTPAAADVIVEIGTGADVESWTSMVAGTGATAVVSVVGAGSPVRIRLTLASLLETYSFTWSFVNLVPDLVLHILSDLQQAPGTFRVTVTNGVPGEAVTFTDSHSDTIIGGTLDENGSLISFAIGISAALTAATYTLTASSTDRDPATANFVVVNAPLSDPTGQPTDADAVTAGLVGGVQKWVFQDPAPAGETYVFEISPDSATSPFGQNAFTTDVTTAPDGQFLIWEGARKSVAWSFKGTLLTQTQYEAFQRFAALNRRVYLIDNRNRAWVVSVEFFDPTPKKVNQNPWAHTYAVDVIIYKGPLTPVTP